MIQKYGLYIVWVVACLGTLGSFYVDEPCCLDWYQRTCLFPLVFIAGIAAWRGFLGITPYILPQTLIGLALAIYQILLLKKASWVFEICGGSEKQPFIPLVSAGVFLCITIILVAISRQNTKRVLL